MTEPHIAESSSRHHFGDGFSGTAPENYERYFVPAIAAHSPPTLSSRPACSLASASWTLRAGRALSHALRLRASGGQEA